MNTPTKMRVDICIVCLLTVMLALASCSSSNEPQSQSQIDYRRYNPQHIGDSLVYSINGGNIRTVNHCIDIIRKGKLQYYYYVWHSIAPPPFIGPDTFYCRTDYNGNVYFLENDSDCLAIDFTARYPATGLRIGPNDSFFFPKTVVAGKFDSCVLISDEDITDAHSEYIYAPDVGLIRHSMRGFIQELIYAKVGTRVYP